MSSPLSSNAAITGTIAAGTLFCAVAPMLDPTGISQFSIAILPALTGLLGNLLMGREQEKEKQAQLDPAREHVNHDLQRLEGDAIKHVLATRCDKSDAAHAKWYRQVGEAAPERWLTIAQHPGLAEIAEHKLPEIFARAADTEDRDLELLTPTIWGAILEKFCQDENIPVLPAARDHAAAQLHRHFFAAVREMAKRSFQGDGRAYAALTLDMDARILSGIETLLERDTPAPRGGKQQTKILREIQATLLKLAEQQRLQLSPEQCADLQPVLSRIDRVQKNLDRLRIEHAEHDAREARRHRRLLAVVLLFMLLAGLGFYLFDKRQGETLQRTVATGEKVGDLDAKMDQVLAALADKPAPQPGAESPPPLSPEILEAARQLAERGDKVQKLVGSVALGDETTALPLLEELKKTSVAETFRLLTLEGDLWYGKGEFDKAIPPYEAAWHLQPGDFAATSNLAISLAQARLGSIETNQLRAIDLFQSALTSVPESSQDWAMTQNNLGSAWLNVPTGDRAENLQKGIACYEAALKVSTREAHPVDWARIQNNLAVSWAELPTGNRLENLRQAIRCFEAALEVHTREAHPMDWAGTQNNLGGAWQSLPTDDRTENLQKAIACYHAALEVYTREAHPVDWAKTQSNFGAAWQSLPTGDRAENLQKAIACYEAALQVRTREAYPVDWAMSRIGLGSAWIEMPVGDPAENLRMAIACFEAALEVCTREAHPVHWAMTQNNLGGAWLNLPTGDRAENLQKAIACYHAALEVYTREAHPVGWAMTQYNLGIAWADLPTGDRAENLREAIACYKAALEVYTREARPVDWAMTQNNLGTAWQELPMGNRAENLQKAIACYEAALQVRTREAHPVHWAMSRIGLGSAWIEMPVGDRAENLRMAIACFEAALEVCTREAHPVHWAMTQNNMCSLFRRFAETEADSFRCGHLSDAARAVKGALAIYTEASFPDSHTMAIEQLEAVRAAYLEHGCGDAAAFDAIAPAT